MARYHLSPNDGIPRKCSAKFKCEYAYVNDGKGVTHYPNKAAAMEAYAENMKKSHDTFADIKRDEKKATVDKADNRSRRMRLLEKTAATTSDRGTLQYAVENGDEGVLKAASQNRNLSGDQINVALKRATSGWTQKNLSLHPNYNKGSLDNNRGGNRTGKNFSKEKVLKMMFNDAHTFAEYVDKSATDAQARDLLQNDSASPAARGFVSTKNPNISQETKVLALKHIGNHSLGNKVVKRMGRDVEKLYPHMTTYQKVSVVRETDDPVVLNSAVDTLIGEGDSGNWENKISRRAGLMDAYRSPLSNADLKSRIADVDEGLGRFHKVSTLAENNKEDFNNILPNRGGHVWTQGTSIRYRLNKHIINKYNLSEKDVITYVNDYLGKGYLSPNYDSERGVFTGYRD